MLRIQFNRERVRPICLKFYTLIESSAAATVFGAQFLSVLLRSSMATDAYEMPILLGTWCQATTRTTLVATRQRGRATANYAVEHMFPSTYRSEAVSNVTSIGEGSLLETLRYCYLLLFIRISTCKISGGETISLEGW